MNPNHTPVIKCRLPRQLIVKVDAIAARRGKSRSDVLRNAIALYLDPSLAKRILRKLDDLLSHWDGQLADVQNLLPSEGVAFRGRPYKIKKRVPST